MVYHSVLDDGVVFPAVSFVSLVTEVTSMQMKFRSGKPCQTRYLDVPGS